MSYFKFQWSNLLAFQTLLVSYSDFDKLKKESIELGLPEGDYEIIASGKVPDGTSIISEELYKKLEGFYGKEETEENDK